MFSCSVGNAGSATRPGLAGLAMLLLTGLLLGRRTRRF